MTSFNYSASDYSHSAYASFGNDFNNFGYSSNSNLGGGADGAESFSGVRTLLPLTNTAEHQLQSQLEGQFILSIHKFEYVNAIDTTYRDTLLIEMSGHNANLDNKSIGFGRFYSYINSDNVNPYEDERNIGSLYWVEDSIYINTQTIHGVFGGAIDTVHYIYSGIRL